MADDNVKQVYTGLMRNIKNAKSMRRQDILEKLNHKRNMLLADECINIENSKFVSQQIIQIEIYFLFI